jgi:hypothetical protein
MSGQDATGSVSVRRESSGALASKSLPLKSRSSARFQGRALLLDDCESKGTGIKGLPSFTRRTKRLARVISQEARFGDRRRGPIEVWSR